MHKVLISMMSFLALGVVACSSADDTASSSSEDLKSCKGALPDICEKCSDGTTECAHWVKENGECEVQICPPAKAGECNSASDCTGPLPMICEECNGGGEQCAHHACVDHQCTTKICD